GGRQLLDHEIVVDTQPDQTRLVSEPLPEDGQYRLVFYFGGHNAPIEFWMDDVVLRPVHNEQAINIKQTPLTTTGDDTFEKDNHLFTGDRHCCILPAQH